MTKSEGVESKYHSQVKHLILVTLIFQALTLQILGMNQIYAILQQPDSYDAYFLSLTTGSILFSLIPILAAIHFWRPHTPVGIVFLWALLCTIIGISSLWSVLFGFNPVSLFFLIPGLIGVLGTMYVGPETKRMIV